MRIATNPAITSALQDGKLAAPTGQAGAPGEDFAQMLMDVLKDVNDSQQHAGELQTDLITNRRPVDYHDVMIAMEKANTTLQLTMAVRNKILDAYQEISKMQV